jgi:hypothetical protein
MSARAWEGAPWSFDTRLSVVAGAQREADEPAFACHWLIGPREPSSRRVKHDAGCWDMLHVSFPAHSSRDQVSPSGILVSAACRAVRTRSVRVAQDVDVLRRRPRISPCERIEGADKFLSLLQRLPALRPISRSSEHKPSDVLSPFLILGQACRPLHLPALEAGTQFHAAASPSDDARRRLLATPSSLGWGGERGEVRLPLHFEQEHRRAS